MQVVPGRSLFEISDVSAAGEVRRAAVSMAGLLGFDESSSGSVAIIAAELSKNIAIHARHGQIQLRPLERDGISGIELVAK